MLTWRNQTKNLSSNVKTPEDFKYASIYLYANSPHQMHRLPEQELKRKQEKCPSKNISTHLPFTLETRTNHSNLPLTNTPEASSFHSLLNVLHSIN